MSVKVREQVRLKIWFQGSTSPSTNCCRHTRKTARQELFFSENRVNRYLLTFCHNRPPPECEFAKWRCTRKSRGGTSLCKQGHSYSAAEGEIGQYCRQSIVPGAVVPVTADKAEMQE